MKKRSQIIRNVSAIILPPILFSLTRSFSQIGYDSFLAGLLLYIFAFYLWAALYTGLSYVVLKMLHSPGRWWKYCLLVFFIAFLENAYSNFHIFEKFHDYTFEHLTIVKSGYFTKEGKLYLAKQTLFVSCLYSLGVGLFFLIRGRKNLMPQSHSGIRNDD